MAHANKGSPCYGYGCEMTLYLTTHSLKRADSSDGNAPVYVSVFTCNRDENGNPYANGGSTRAQLVPVVRRLDEAIKVVKDKISQVTDLL